MTQDTQPQKDTPILFGKGTIAAIIAIVIILVALLIVAGMQSGQGTAVPPAACGEKTITFINNNLVTPGTSAELLSTGESRGLYELKIQYQSQEVTLYTTKDCTLLFTNAVNMTINSGAQQSPKTAPAPIKSARPAVDLYVMSFCPYGTQAETSMQPVFELLNGKADFRVRYIATISGTTADSVDSLHGPSEAAEDLRQICINKNYPAKFWPYLTAFNTACYPSWQNATALAACRKDTLASLGIDSTKIETCASGSEGMVVLQADGTETNKNGVSGSPTLIINGVTYSGARTPEAYKQAICNSFDTVPAECSTVLSSASASASSGGCG
jgi:glutaredoxin